MIDDRELDDREVDDLDADPADPLVTELALDRLEAELAAELPGHMRAFAGAHASGAPSPPAPEAARRVSSLSIARASLAHPALASRGLTLLRLIAPLVVDSAPSVVRARAAAPSWPALRSLAAAREEASRARCGCGFLALIHALHARVHADAPPLDAVPALSASCLDPDPLAGWTRPDHRLHAADIDALWRELAHRHGVAGQLSLSPSEAARPRAFVVEPGREVIAVIPSRVDTPAARFAVLHELGHGLAGLLSPVALPRSVDEAVASYSARAMESAAHPWHSPLAAPARARRSQLASRLDAIERALPALIASDVPLPEPPPALWHDPGSQASYVRAEQLADRWSASDLASDGALSLAIARESSAIAAAAIASILESPR